MVGDDREKFQHVTSEEFEKVLSEKEITSLYGLVRHVYILKEVREPIQTAFIADELKLTRIQEQETAKGKKRTCVNPRNRSILPQKPFVSKRRRKSLR
ncbi:MAG: hypothetical protein R3C11_28415 [Planctomycetaceae bacterium]